MGGRGAEGAGDEGDSPIRIVLSAPLPCGMGTCRQPAREALAEPDPVYPGAWVLLPICPSCGAHTQAAARRIVLSTRR